MWSIGYELSQSAVCMHPVVGASLMAATPISDSCHVVAGNSGRGGAADRSCKGQADSSRHGSHVWRCKHWRCHIRLHPGACLRISLWLCSPFPICQETDNCTCSPPCQHCPGHPFHCPALQTHEQGKFLHDFWSSR